MELEAAQGLLSPVLHCSGPKEGSRSQTKVLRPSSWDQQEAKKKKKAIEKVQVFFITQVFLVPRDKLDLQSRWVSHRPRVQESRTTPTIHNIYALTRIPDFASSQTTKEWGLRVWFILKHNMKRGFHWQFPLANTDTPCSGGFGPWFLNTLPREVVGLPYLTALWQIWGCLVRLLLQKRRLWANYCPQDQ